ATPPANPPSNSRSRLASSASPGDRLPAMRARSTSAPPSIAAVRSAPDNAAKRGQTRPAMEIDLRVMRGMIAGKSREREGRRKPERFYGGDTTGTIVTTGPASAIRGQGARGAMLLVLEPGALAQTCGNPALTP